MNEPKLKDYIKRGMHPEHLKDLFYLVIPLMVVSCLITAALIVGILKLVELKIID